jgi:hypothetical protein
LSNGCVIARIRDLIVWHVDWLSSIPVSILNLRNRSSFLLGFPASLDFGLNLDPRLFCDFLFKGVRFLPFGRGGMDLWHFFLFLTLMFGMRMGFCFGRAVIGGRAENPGNSPSKFLL